MDRRNGMKETIEGLNEWVNGWINGWIEGMDGWMDGRKWIHE